MLFHCFADVASGQWWHCLTDLLPVLGYGAVAWAGLKLWWSTRR